MKTMKILLVYGVMLVSVLFVFRFNAQDTNFDMNYTRSASLLGKGSWRYGLLSRGEYGWNDKITISAHPLWFWIAPSMEVKWNITTKEAYSISVFHTLSSPNPVMNLVSRSGTGGLISPEFKIPFMLSVRNGMLITYTISPKNKLTGELSIAFALFNKTLSPSSSIDLPVISPRNQLYYKNAGLNISLSNLGNLKGRLDYFTKAEGFIYPIYDKEYNEAYGATGQFFSEFTGIFYYHISKKSILGLGGRLCYGNYPYGSQWHLLPLLDFVRLVR